MRIEFLRLVFMTAKPIEKLWGGGEFLAKLGGARVGNVPAAVCNVLQVNF